MIEKLYRRPGQTVVTATQRLWLTSGKDKIVEEGSPDSAFLLCNPGQIISIPEAERLGLYGGDAPAAEVKPVEPGQPGDPEVKPIFPARSRRR